MYSWDPTKAIGNFEKHGVSFEEAATVFSDQLALEVDDIDHSDSESRFIRLGRSTTERILTVVYTIRERDHGQETIRIISARAASRKERKAYHGQRD
jgi:uncharacterized protein